MRGSTDAELVRLARSGDLCAFEELVERHEQRVYTVARRITGHEHDAQDVTQQTFLDAIEHLHQFRAESSFSTWLFRIATYAALKVNRKRKGLPTVSLEEMAESGTEDGQIPHPDFISDWKESPSRLAQRKETRKLIEDALEQLDEKHRLVFLLRDVEGLSVSETAEALGLSEANVKVRLLRARLQLRERLTRAFGDETRRIDAGHKHSL